MTQQYKGKHDRRCFEEVTRDAIFLFQVRHLQLLDVPHDEDDEHFDFTDGVLSRIKDADGNDLDEPQDIDIADWVEQQACMSIGDIPCVVEEWETKSVWLDREEAESWGKSHEYRFKYGWRVYCVCAEGELAKLLKSQDESKGTS